MIVVLILDELLESKKPWALYFVGLLLGIFQSKWILNITPSVEFSFWAYIG
jgi:hypothetical protein